jgi:GntR family transcriptional regulator, transcriptional repressor for pyruvate dehydrogenase complex
MMNNHSNFSRHLDPISRTTVVDEIVERLIGLIIHEGLKPGDQLMPERELMAKLEVGRSSLREAIKTLCALGILEIKRGTGTFVGYGDTSMLTKPLSWGLFLNQSSIQQVIESRSVIEVALAGWAALRATDEEIATIGRLLAQLEADQNDMSRYVESDLAFHLGIARAAHNDMLANVLTMFQHVLRVWMETTYKEAKSTTDSMALHREIYAAIQARDEMAAREAMAEHTSGSPLLAAAARSFANGLPPLDLYNPDKYNLGK